MIKSPRFLVVANWKMNPGTATESNKLFSYIRKLHVPPKTKLVICPPVSFLAEMKTKSRTNIAFGVQDIFYENKGSFTGEISVTQVKSIGATYAIVGHSERRALCDSDDIVQKKLACAIKNGFKVILCVGERERDNQGTHLVFIKNQITHALSSLKKGDFKNISIAYEPIWAIGKTADEAITPERLHEMMLYIRKVLIDNLPKVVTNSVRIMYGGSVESVNAETLIKDGHTHGFLVGHASLEPKEFGAVLSASKSYMKAN